MSHGLRLSVRIARLPICLRCFGAVALGLSSIPTLAQSINTPIPAPADSVQVGRAFTLLAQRKSNGNATDLMNKAAASFHQSNYTAAIALWTQVITSNPPLTVVNEALTNRAKAFLILGQPALALVDLDASRHQPNETRAPGEYWLLKGSALLQNKQYTEAITAFATAE